MLALENIRVLDLTHLPPGALCTMMLADFGADVIKITAPPAISERGAGAAAMLVENNDERAVAFDVLNRNKRSIQLNLKSEEARKIFYQLVSTADVIVEGFRPGTVKRLKVDYETARTINSRIVYCSLSGYGQDGPYSSFSGHDINYISIAGALGIIGTSEAPSIPLNLLADFAGASLHGVIGILTALIAREKSGVGQYVDVSYTDGVINLLSWFFGLHFATGISLARGQSWLHGVYPYYGVYRTKDDKFISIGCVEPWLWENLCRALGKEGYIPYHIAPEHFFQPPQEEKWAEISSYLQEVFLTRTRDEWFDFLSSNNIPVGKVYSLDEVAGDSQIVHRQMIVEIDQPFLGRIRQPGIAIKLSETPGKIRRLAPRPGEHTDEILMSLGYDAEQIEQLRQRKVVG
jgi:crotonobetainyl-CoA:carnitine CoA-transferase CaiB-like acyl-CoA transferase